MKRREFVAGLATAPLWANCATAQSRVPVVGILVTGNRDPRPFLDIFKQEMNRLGYPDGQGIRIVVRSGENGPESLPDLARGLVESRVDVIVAWFTPAVRAAKQATSQIPIVMAGAGDPVATGLVASLARPGGNVTGMTGVAAELAGKNVELIRELLPSARKLVGLCNATDIFTRPFLEQIQLAASKAEFELIPIMIERLDEIEASLARFGSEKADAVIVQPSLPNKRAAALALAAHCPSASPTENFTDDGGLLSYSGRSSQQFRMAAAYVDKILKGSRPSDLPIQQPTQFDLKINLRTAKALGLTIPSGMLARADGLVE
jgi:putative tryptophan/tyrosine transport system substrate-binding protein